LFAAVETVAGVAKLVEQAYANIFLQFISRCAATFSFKFVLKLV